MRTQTDPELTVPSLIASLAGKYGASDLLLTIIFHPDIDRIGQQAVVPRDPKRVPWVLGRRSPPFAGPDTEEATPLDDPHVSRRALELHASDRRLVITRFEGSSRCRVGGSELFDTVEISWEQLTEGISLTLGHSIVLMLRLGREGFARDATAIDATGLRGSSRIMSDVRTQVGRAARSDLDVLIRGETGTGKELVAHAVHRASSRNGGPLVTVNMAAIPGELAAAALFGSERGAYTGAERAKPGYFQQAEGGTLFLDEVGDTPTDVQSQMLRALQQREIQVVGGAVRKVDVRVISATDVDLEASGGGFRAALRHRLGACEIHLPSLREHPQDIGELLYFFLARSACETGRNDLLPHAASEAPEIAAWALLFYTFLQYPWPGNVRELQNFAQQVVLSSGEKPDITASLRAAFDARKRGEPIASRRRLQDIDNETFDHAMSDNDFEVVRVAQQLGVSRASIYRRISSSPHYRLANAIPAGELREALEQHGGDVAAVAMALRVPLNSLRSRLRGLDWR